MPRHTPSYPLSRMTKGINRFVEEAKRDQLTHGLDVIADDGELRRRDGFRSVAMAAPHLLPTHRTTMVGVRDSDQTNKLITDRATFGEDMETIYIGSDIPFDGFLWPQAPPTASVGYHLKLELEYYNGSSWVEITPEGALDRTIKRNGDHLYTLERNGHVSWHPEDVSDWATISVPTGASLNILYWVKLKLYDPADFLYVSWDTTLLDPGARVFHLAPVNGLFPVRVGGAPQLVVGSDRRTPRGQEKGAQLGAVTGHLQATKALRLIEDEGAGVYDQVTWPQWQKGGTPVGSSGLQLGTSGVLRKIREDYDWQEDQHRGGVLKESLTSGTWGSGSLSIQFGSSLSEFEDDTLEHCVLVCTADVSGTGTPVGEQRTVWKNALTNSQLYLGEAFSIDPDSQNVFELRLPAAEVEMDGYAERFEVESNDEHEITLVEGRNHVADPSSVIGSDVERFNISRELRWSVRAGLHWSAIVDTITQHLILTNGEAMLEYDGRELRELTADLTSQAAQTYASQLADQQTEIERPTDQAMAVLEAKPPVGRYLVQYRNRLVVAGIRGEPYLVRYSAPYANNVWPMVYEAYARDQHQDPITGLAVIYDRLVAFTPTAIHESTGPDENGFMSFRPAAQGVGFSSHWAVAQVALPSGGSALVGPNADGVYLYNGSEPQPVLDDWARVLDGGVNPHLLGRAVGAVAPQRRWYLLAVASAGSDRLDRILVWDYGANAWWVWSARFGVSSIAIDNDNTGKERILIGTDSGHVMRYGGLDLDDDWQINAEAHTPWLKPFGQHEQSVQALLVTARDLGNASMTVGFGVEREDRDRQSSTVYVDRLEARWGTDNWASDGSTRWSKTAYQKTRVNVAAGTKANLLQVRISGNSAWKVRDLEVLARPLSRRGRR